jgi:hypothetical protein
VRFVLKTTCCPSGDHAGLAMLRVVYSPLRETGFAILLDADMTDIGSVISRASGDEVAIRLTLHMTRQRIRIFGLLFIDCPQRLT